MADKITYRNLFTGMDSTMPGIAFGREAGGADFYEEGENPVAAEYGDEAGAGAVTRAEVRQMIDESLAALKIYILESDITEAQNSVKAIVEQSVF